MGASGAIFGLVGVVGVDLIQNWKRIKCPIVQMVVWVISVIISLAFGLLPGIDNFAHLGGFVQGIIGACVRLTTPVDHFGMRGMRSADVLGFGGPTDILADRG